MSLFRREAVQQQQQKYYGAIVLRSPKVFVWLSFGVLFLVVLLGCILVFGQYTRRASLNGYVIPAGGVLRVHSALPGLVASIHVREGQEVHADQALATVIDERFRDQGMESRQAVIAQIESRQRSLRTVIEQQKQLYQRTLAGLQSRMQGLQRELAQLQQEQLTLQKRLELAQTMEQRFKDLHAQNFASLLQLQEKGDIVSELRYRVQINERNQTSITRELNALQTEHEVLPLRERTQLAELERSLQSSEQELIEAQARRQLVIRASVPGRVAGLTAKLGGLVVPERPLLTLVPQQSSPYALEVHLFAPSRDAGFIRPGQTVRMRYHAFPYQKFGHYDGTVVEVSGTPLLPAELPYPVMPKPTDASSFIPGMPQLPSTEPLYRVQIKPEKNHTLAYGEKQMLQTGMQLEADVMLDTRSILEWIFEPLISVRGKYF